MHVIVGNNVFIVMSFRDHSVVNAVHIGSRRNGYHILDILIQVARKLTAGASHSSLAYDRSEPTIREVLLGREADVKLGRQIGHQIRLNLRVCRIDIGRISGRRHKRRSGKHQDQQKLSQFPPPNIGTAWIAPISGLP